MAKRSNKSGGDRQAAVNLLEAQADAAERVGVAAQEYQQALDLLAKKGQEYRDSWGDARNTWGWSEGALRSLPSVSKTGAPPRAPKTRTKETADSQQPS